MQRRYVALCGPHDASDEERALAAEVGRLLAESGAVLVTGAGTGVMEASSRAAHEAGGTVLGFVAGDSRDEANDWCTIAVPTGMGEGRNVLVVRASDAVITLGGGWGTLSEIGLAMKMGRPVISLGGWEPRVRGRSPAGIRSVTTPAEAVRAALRC
ncbi:MAG TPA: TIGR00725 family protein [Actinomycetota bacterium]|nr:TIGR00725 family protein [Actinomycetota bacterium]